MIRLDLPADASAAERWACDTLIDLSRLLRAEGAVPGAVVVSAGEGEGISAAGGIVRIGRHTLRRVVETAGASVEQRSTGADKHDRVPAEENPLVRAGTERVPEIQRLANDLRRVVVEVAGADRARVLAPWPNGHRWAAAMTHDLDVVSGWPVFTGARAFELLRKGRVGDVLRVGASALASVGRGPVLAALRDVLATERRLGIRATWFVLVGDPTFHRWMRGDVTYRLEDASVREAISAIRADGHEVGLHGSMETGTDLPAFRRERARLGAVTTTPPLGVRQHFLKMRPGLTQAAMHQAGFAYDATYGFSGRNGFRLGVADVVQAWDERAQTGLGLSLVPLQWMDRALSKYQGVEDPNALVDDGLALAEVVREAEGLWVGLWHPNLAPALGYPGAPAAFTRMLETLVTRSPWMATLAQVVEWRTARRQLRARGVRPDGRLDVAGSTSTTFEFRIEDGTGRRVA